MCFYFFDVMIMQTHTAYEKAWIVFLKNIFVKAYYAIITKQ
jgi:hypothetical protein